MNRIIRTVTLLGTLLTFGPLGLSSASSEDRHAVLVEGTGTYSRPIGTTSEQAQKFFDQGLRLMYGYYIPEAIASHMEALRHDPDNPMIHVALALALGPNPNSRYGRLPDDPQGQARRSIERAIRLLDAADARTRAFAAAVHVRFDVSRFPDMDERDQAYLRAMRDLFEAYPDDPDFGTLYADAYMVTNPWRYWTAEGTAKPGTEVAAQALESVIASYPDHPGANHIYIHLTEAGPEPERALPSADRLAALMPIAGHVVHMPSHIYVRTGQYERAIATNEKSVLADKKLVDLWGDLPHPQSGTYFLSATNHRRHAIDFIRYAASVQGNYSEAIAAARKARSHQNEDAIKRGPGQRDVVTPWLMHKMFGKWDELAAEARVHEGTPYIDGIWLYVHGSLDVAQGNLKGAEEMLKALRELRDSPAAGSTYSRFNSVASLLGIAASGLEGEIRQAQGDYAGAIASFKDAVRLEDSLSYVEPPDWAQPMRHYLGAALLESDRPAEAEMVYRRDLAWNRGNGWSLYGLWRSLAAQGRTTEARDVRAQFEAAWGNADVTLSSSRF